MLTFFVLFLGKASEISFLAWKMKSMAGTSAVILKHEVNMDGRSQTLIVSRN